MNDTRSTNRASSFTTRIAVVLCLLLALGMVPIAAFAAPTTMSDVEATYLNSATISLRATGSAKTYSRLDSAATAEGDSVTTGVYGAHILEFWSTDTSGDAEATVTAPFFVDENVAPVVGSDAKASYPATATIKVTATDNFKGSGVDFLCYRVDGGKIITAIAPARVQATKVLLGKIAAITVNAAAGPPDITPTTEPPANHYGSSCAACHTVVVPTPEPTSTPEPTGTPAPSDGVSADVIVAGAGTHKIEYWAQDIARNTTAHVTKSFEIAAATVTPTPPVTPKPPVVVKKPINTYLKANYRSVRKGGYITLTAKLTAAHGVKFRNTYVRFEVLRKGSHHYVLARNVKVSASGYATLRYKLIQRGTRYHRVRFLSTPTYRSSPIRRGIALSVR